MVKQEQSLMGLSVSLCALYCNCSCVVSVKRRFASSSGMLSQCSQSRRSVHQIENDGVLELHRDLRHFRYSSDRDYPLIGKVLGPMNPIR